MRSFRLPALGQNRTSATVIRWLKRPGESLDAGDKVLELETEDAIVVVESSAAGTLGQLLVQPGQTIAAGTELAHASEAEARTKTATSGSIEETVVSEQSSQTTGGKVIPILMPQAGNTMEEGTVLDWRVREGEPISVGQVLCEIETDKATIDFESPDTGRLARIIAKAGAPILVKQPIAVLADNDADADAYVATLESGASPPETASATVAEPATSQGGGERHVLTPTVPGDGRIKASPAARKIAEQRGIALATVGAGSGPGGRILSTDLELGAGNGITAVDRSTAGPRRRTLSKMRRAIGLNLQQSKQTIPHFYVRLTIDAGPLLQFYGEHKSTASCTLNDVIVLAVGRAIGEFAAVRSQIEGNDIVEHPHANIGIAVGMDEGLVVPVVLAVDTLSLTQLAAESKRIVESARKGRLENVGKGVFTISNLGMFGVEEFGAIINPPESGILAISAIRETVVAENGAIRAGRTMTMTLSADHRIVDGVVAAKFMARLKEILEKPAGELK